MARAGIHRIDMATKNLTGVWQGLFTYPAHIRAGNFTATLIETASALSGSTSELGTVPPRVGETLFAMLAGRRNGGDVRFTKTYEGPEPPNHSVEYEGALTDDFLEIEGRWIIPNVWAGRFLMIRSGGRSVEVARKAFERA